VTFRDLKKRVSLEVIQQQSKPFERLKDKPFWIWNIEEHKLEDIKTDGDCCFNHIIELPQKDKVDKPLYDYEQIIFDSLVTQNGNKHLWIKKATGLGVSEFMLRFMAWLCLKDNALSGSQTCIVTGPRIDLAIALIDRMKKLSDYMPEIHKAKQENRKPDMRIVPVNFNSEHKAMLGHSKMILEQDPGKIAINPDKFDKLITALRTAVNNDGTLDKEATSYNDIFDAFRLALKFYHFRDSSDYD
jgi:hypothetical protein